MKIEVKTQSEFPLKASELLPGLVYQTSSKNYIIVIETIGAVDLADGYFYSSNNLQTKHFRQVEAKVVIE